MMKTKNILLISLAFMLIFAGCGKDFLDVPAVGVVSENDLKNKDGINSLVIGAYSSLNGAYASLGSTPAQLLFGSVRGGEAYKGSLAGDLPTMLEFSKFNISTGNTQLLEPFQFFYDAIYRCNLVLRMLDEVSDAEISPAEKNGIRAEMRFLRGHFHFYAKRIYGNIPYIDETVTDYRVPNTDAGGGYVNIWPQITQDFDFARKNLPETQKEVGRPNKWAAEAYYAKVLIYRANFGEYAQGYQEALPILESVINNGVTTRGLKYALLPNYHDNFNADRKNGAESVFAVQHSINDGSPGATRFDNAPNGNNIMIFIGARLQGAPGEGGFNFVTPTEWFVDHFRTDEDGLPYLDMYDTNPHKLKDDYGLPSPVGPDTFEIDDAPVDPRLDWTVARRNIPCLGYGNMPGAIWFKDQLHGGPYFTKKWHIYKNQVGTYSTPGFPQNSMNVDVIRFADVLLLAAEVQARVGDLNKARSYVNQIRQRMVDNSSSPDHWVKLSDNVTNAANYQIGVYPTGGDKDPFQSVNGALDAILYERLLELGLEGHRFFDVVRFGKGDEEFNAFIESAKPRYSYFSDAVYRNSINAIAPIPQLAIDNSQLNGLPTLKQNPGY